MSLVGSLRDCAGSDIVIKTNGQACSFCVGIILLEVWIYIGTAQAGATIYAFNAGVSHLFKINIALIHTYINALVGIR